MTPPRLLSRGSRLRASAPAPLAAMLGAPRPAAHPEVWVNPGALSTPPAAYQADMEGAMRERDERLFMANMVGNRAAADATGSAAAAAAAATATAKLLVTRAAAGGALPGQGLASDLTAPRPCTAHGSCTAVHGFGGHRALAPNELQHELARGGLPSPGPNPSSTLGSTRPTLGAPGNPRWGPGQPLQQFVPTRGLMYSVFSELDPGDTGKLTYSTFEEACVVCGLRKEQVDKLFSTLDPEARGYFTMRDWGAKEHEKQVLDFTRLYVHATRGATGRPLGMSELRSAKLAIQVALHKLQIKNNGHVVSQEQLMRAFDFIDSDASGALSLAEIQDAFNAMGIYVTPAVLTEIMEKFDANGNGVIEYREFVGTLYPVLSRGL